MTYRHDTRPPHERYLQAATRVLSRTDRIITGDPAVKVTLPEYGPAPAWTDGQTICLRSKDWVTSYKDEGALARVMGLNYHEVCHILHTPRRGSAAYAAIEASQYDLLPVLNLADDQRIEMLFTTRFTPAIPFFVQAVTDLILVDGADIRTTWALVAGRRYLSKRLRDAARAAYAGDADEWDRLISAYLLIDWETDIPAGVALLEQMYEHLGHMAQTPPDGCGTPMPASGTPINSDAEREQIAADMEAEADEAEQAEADDDEADDDGADTEGTDADGGTEADETPEAENADDAEAEGDEAEAEQDGAGTDATEGDDDPEPESLEEAAEAEAEAWESAVQEQVESTEHQVEVEIERPTGQIGDSFPNYNERTLVTPAAQAAAHDLIAVLSELRSLVDPGWLSHRSRGRINSGRYLRRERWEAPDDVFDEYVEGAEEAMDIEIALLVDTSSSMTNLSQDGNSLAHGAAEGAWALKRALDHYDIPCAVIAFDSTTETIFGANDRADAQWMPTPLARGGTQPAKAIVEVGRYFAASDHKRRILVALTDGQWMTAEHLMQNGQRVAVSYPDLVGAVDAELRVLLRYRSSGVTYSDNLGFDAYEDIDDTSKLVDAVRTAIVDGVKRTGIERLIWQ